MYVFVKRQNLRDKYVCFNGNKYVLTTKIKKAIKFNSYGEAFKFKLNIIMDGVKDSKITFVGDI